jgi:hypothetical protein
LLVLIVGSGCVAFAASADTILLSTRLKRVKDVCGIIHYPRRASE